jgi:DNA-binding LacI/PurR family transcriptional regulator
MPRRPERGQQVTTDDRHGRRQRVMADVADCCGVSYQTVSRVINGHPRVAAETRRRVEQAIVELGYRPNAAARALVRGTTQTLGLVTAGPHDHGSASTVTGAERAAREAGFAVRLVLLEGTGTAALQEAVDSLTRQSAAAVIAIGADADLVEAVRSVRGPVPVVATRQAVPERGSATGVDQRDGARTATRHLLDQGHATVHHLCGPAASLDAQDRAAGWREALVAAHRPVPTVLHGDWTAASGYRAGVRLAHRVGGAPTGRMRPTAVFVANDQMALGVLRALQEAGLSVPRDLSVVGYDGRPETAYFSPPLSTVRHDFAGLGADAVTVALALLDGREPPAAGAAAPELIVRASSAPPPVGTRQDDAAEQGSTCAGG